MKTALLSLIIAISVALLSLFQFEKYQKFSLATQQRLSSLESKLTSNAETTQAAIQELSTYHKSILSRVAGGNSSLLEAESLSRLAQMRLQTDRDLKAAITLLSRAQEKVQKIDDPTLNVLLETLAHDLATLQNLALPDPTTLWLQIGTLIEQTANIPLRGIPPASSAMALPPVASSTPITLPWQEALAKSWQDIKNLVKIRHYTKPVEPVLAETEQTMIKENLRLMLEEIRFAVLSNKNPIYQQAIQETLDWLRKYFDDNDQTVKDIQSGLMALAAINLFSELPMITSLEQFSALR